MAYPQWIDNNVAMFFAAIAFCVVPTVLGYAVYQVLLFW